MLYVEYYVHGMYYVLGNYIIFYMQFCFALKK